MESGDLLEFRIFFSGLADLVDSSSDEISKLLENCENFLQKYSKNYILEKYGYHLFKDKLNDVENVYGRLHFDNSLDDEYFTLKLLFEFSGQNKNCIIKVWDSSGDFLLADASDHLPSWINEANMENRVFIHRESLFINTNLSDFPSDKPVQLRSSLNWIASNYENLKNDPFQVKISKSIESCFSKFFSLPYPNSHRCNVILPSVIADILYHKPQTISYAAQTFLNREDNELTNLRQIKDFDPSTRIVTSILLSKTLYAQLSASPMFPSKKSDWSTSHFDVPSDSPCLSLGFKITCGFQLLLERVKSGYYIKNDIFLSKKWKSYYENLTSSGYFRGNIEGSKEFVELLNTAKDTFRKNSANSKTDLYNEHIHKKSLEIAEYITNFTEKESDDYGVPLNHPEDDLDWFECNPDKMDQMIEEKFKAKSDPTASFLNNNLTSFIDYRSGIKGVEFHCCENDKDVCLNPMAIEEALNKMLDEFELENNHVSSGEDLSDCEEEDIKDITEIMNDIGNVVKGFDDGSTSKSKSMENLFESVISQTEVNGPAFNLLNQIGLDFNKLK